jgi:hypothetical protein
VIDTAPIRLPGEVPGRKSDPFLEPVDGEISGRLSVWAIGHGATKEELAAPWRTKEELWSARIRLDIASRAGAWLAFDRALSAMVDGDQDALAEALVALGC